MNKIPENWITYKISDLCDFQNGYAFNSSDYVEEGMPIIRMSNISIDGNLNLTSENTKYYPREKAEILKKYVLNKNDVVMAMTDMTKDMGIIGKTAIIDEDNKYLLNQRVGRLIIKNPKILDYKYLHRYTNSPRFLDYAKQHCSGGVQLNLSTKAILNHKIILPSTIEEQEEIAQVLDTMSDIIRLREECISHAQDLIPALFQEMFGNPLKNKTPFKIGQFYNVGTGATPRRENESYYIGNNPWVKTTEVNNCYIEQTEEHISDEAISKTNCTLYEPNTIIMAMYGQGKTRGKVAYLKVSATTNQACAALQLKENYKDEINNIFVFYYLQFIYNYLRTLSQGGGRPNMNLSIVRNIPLYKPDIKLQNIFANKVLEIENYIKEQQEELENAKQMFQSLLHHAFTGELTRRAYGKD